MSIIKILDNLRDTANSNDKLIEGFQLVVDNENFLIFVMDELTGTKRGYILKLMFQDGKSDSVNINDRERFPHANSLFDRFCNGLWDNKPNAKKCYKYVVFGYGESNKIFAVTIMRNIVCDIMMASPIN